MCAFAISCIAMLSYASQCSSRSSRRNLVCQLDDIVVRDHICGPLEPFLVWEALFACRVNGVSKIFKKLEDENVRNITSTHLVLALPSVPLPKTARYKAVSNRLNWSSRDVKLNAGLATRAAAMRALRAFAAVAMEMTSLVKNLATVL